MGYLSVVVLLPLAALVWASRAGGLGSIWDAATQPEAAAALKLTLALAAICALINAVAGTAIAWTLVRDHFPGKGAVDAVIDLPFALPTIVAGLTLLALYGPGGPFGINIAFTRLGLLVALLFVTLPFVVRAVQPVLLELDTEMEVAAASLGARPTAIFRRIVFPNLLPAILSGVTLAFARAVGEFGAVVLISGNIPFKTEVSSVYIFGQLQAGNGSGAAAVSVLLLVISFGVLLAIGGFRSWWASRSSSSTAAAAGSAASQATGSRSSSRYQGWCSRRCSSRCRSSCARWCRCCARSAPSRSRPRRHWAPARFRPSAGSPSPPSAGRSPTASCSRPRARSASSGPSARSPGTSRAALRRCRCT